MYKRHTNKPLRREIGILECVFKNFWGTLENENSRSKPPQKNLTNFLYHGLAANTHTHTFTHTHVSCKSRGIPAFRAWCAPFPNLFSSTSFVNSVLRSLWRVFCTRTKQRKLSVTKLILLILRRDLLPRVPSCRVKWELDILVHKVRYFSSRGGNWIF